MSLQTIAKALVIWTGMLALAIANGALRDGVLMPQLGDVQGMLLSGVLLCCAILAVSYLCLPWFGRQSARHLSAIGVIWLGLTVAFEFSFAILRGMPMDKILGAYVFEDGNTWPLVLVITLLAPRLAARLRGWS